MNAARTHSISRLAALAAMGAVAIGAAFAANAADAYIESDGNQVLNTGYLVGANTKIVADYEFVNTDSTAGARLFGVYHKGATVGFWYNSAGKLWAESGNGDTSAQTDLETAVDTLRHVVTFDCASSSVTLAAADGSGAQTWTLLRTITGSATSPLAIFTTTTGDIPKKDAFVSAAKIYSFRIYESDTLVRDYTPALRDGIAGLHDSITGAFLSALDVTGGVAPATDLAYGGDIETLDIDPYVESNGTQTINTGIYMDDTVKFEIDFSLTTTGQNMVFAGAWQFDSGYKVCAPYVNGGNFKLYNGTAWSFASVVAENTYRHVITIDGPANCFTFQTGLTTNKTITTSYEDGAAPYPIMLFGDGRDAAGTWANMKGKGRIYGVRIWKGGELVRDLAPAVKGGVTGLLDRVSGVMLNDYACAGNGTGHDLASGGTLPVVRDDGYVEASKNAYFVTDYLIKPSTRIVADYAFTATSGNDGRLFGVYKKGATLGFYQHETTQSNRVESGTGSDLNNTYLRLAPNTLRHTLTLDLDNGASSSYMTGFTTNWSGSLVGAVSAVATTPLDIFTTAVSADGHSGSENTYRSNAKIYRLSIYEGDALVRDYVPYVRNGVAGFRDAANGGAFLAPFSGTVAYGGDIDGEEDAYVQAVRTSGSVGQAVNTGYLVKPTTRIAVDFAYDDTSNDGRLFGSYNPKASRVGLYCSSGTVDGVAKPFTVESPGGQLGAVAADTRRHVAVIDYSQASSGSSISTDGTAVWTGGPKGAVTAQGTNPLVLFGTHTGSIGYFASARIYSFRIYEGSTLVHEYLPYKNAAGKVGFWDTVDEAFLAELNGGDFGYGGKGVEGTEKWLKELPATAIVPVEGSITLTAAASGAQRYVWKKNGETIDSAVGESLVVPWTRGDYDTPDTYSVTAVYDVYGRATEGEPIECLVTRNAAAFVIVVK